MKKILCALLCVVLLIACIPCLPVSAGTAATPLSELNGTTVTSGTTYSISNVEELKKFASLCTSENNWCEGVTFIITDDINLNEGWTASATAPTGEGAVTWEPIKIFKGVLDGQNHTVKGFYVPDSIDYKAILGTGSEHAAGIFCILSGKTCAVKNLNIENSYIRSQKFAGAIAGVTDPSVDCNGLTISNVSVSAIVESSGNGVGGILGNVFNGNTSGTVYISDCVFSGEVRATNQVGGFVGTGWRNITITNCVNNGRVCSTANSNIGGIYGCPQGGTVTITGCVNNGELVMSNKTETNVGGIVGFHNGTTKLEIDGCVNNADITCNVIGSQPSIGGIVGKTKSNNTIVKNSVNMGDIILVKNGTVTNHNVGGIIGYSEGVITVNGCANFGDITSEDEMGCSIGGIIGAPSPAITATNVQSITDCLSAGDISVKSSYPGGIVGNYQRQNLKLTRCVVLGTVTELAAGNNGAYGGALIANINNSLNITFEDCYYNNAYKPLPTWAGLRADYGKLSFTVKATGKDDVLVEYTAGVNPTAVTNALKAGCAMSKASMSDLNAIQNLTALDWANVTDNGWKLEKVDGQNIPMPTAVAELIAEEVVEKDNGVDYKGVQVATDKGAVRFVATVDDLDRDNIGFEVLVIKNGAHATYTLETETVYTSLLYNDLTKPEGEQSTEYSVDGKFLCALAFTDIPASGTVTFVVKTFTETEGVRTYDDTRVVSVNNGNVYTYIR